MAVLDRKELEESPLSDLHAIASELGIEGYRLLRREKLIEAILGGSAAEEGEPERPRPRRSRGGRGRDRGPRTADRGGGGADVEEADRGPRTADRGDREERE